MVAGGAVIGRGDVAYGGSLEATLIDKDFPLGRVLSPLDCQLWIGMEILHLGGMKLVFV